MASGGAGPGGPFCTGWPRGVGAPEGLSVPDGPGGWGPRRAFLYRMAPGGGGPGGPFCTEWPRGVGAPEGLSVPNGPGGGGLTGSVGACAGVRGVRWSADRPRGARSRALPGRRRGRGRGQRGLPQRLARLVRATTPTSSCRTCPATSWPARWPRSAPGVRGWSVGDRVTVPFVCACGSLRAVPRTGDQQVCLRQTQPGFTHWGSLAELVALDAADVNLVAAARGARPAPPPPRSAAGYATAFRAVTGVGRVGAGGVGGGARLRRASGCPPSRSRSAAGARVVAVDPSPGARELAAATGRRAHVTAARTCRRRSSS